MADPMHWFSVRTVVFRPGEGVYEERITLWCRADTDAAADAALAESAEYAADVGGEDRGPAQVYEPYGDTVGDCGRRPTAARSSPWCARAACRPATTSTPSSTPAASSSVPT